MRGAAAFALAISASLLVLGPASAQRVNHRHGAAAGFARPGSCAGVGAPALAGAGPDARRLRAAGAGGEVRGEVRQSECARRVAHSRDRHHRRPGFRLRAFQATRLPARQGSRADLRRRPVADHAGRAQGAGRRMRQGDLLPDRQARHLLSGNPPAGRGGRPHHRLAHLVAPGPVDAQVPGRGQGRDREGHQRGASGRSRIRARRRRSSASRRCAIRPRSSPISASATSRSSRPTWTRSTSRCASPNRS